VNLEYLYLVIRRRIDLIELCAELALVVSSREEVARDETVRNAFICALRKICNGSFCLSVWRLSKVGRDFQTHFLELEAHNLR
jgi:hypothetical protein